MFLFFYYTFCSVSLYSLIILLVFTFVISIVSQLYYLLLLYLTSKLKLKGTDSEGQ